VHAFRKVDKEACERNKIDPDSPVTGEVLGKVILYDVKVCDSKHSAGSDFPDPNMGS